MWLKNSIRYIYLSFFKLLLSYRLLLKALSAVFLRDVRLRGERGHRQVPRPLYFCRCSFSLSLYNLFSFSLFFLSLPCLFCLTVSHLLTWEKDVTWPLPDLYSPWYLQQDALTLGELIRLLQQHFNHVDLLQLRPFKLQRQSGLTMLSLWKVAMARVMIDTSGSCMTTGSRSVIVIDSWLAVMPAARGKVNIIRTLCLLKSFLLRINSKARNVNPSLFW